MWFWRLGVVVGVPVWRDHEHLVLALHLSATAERDLLGTRTGLIEVLRRYAGFYLVTSLWWDLARAIGNGLLTWLMARPVLGLLRRFERRFFYLWSEQPMDEKVTAPGEA